VNALLGWRVFTPHDKQDSDEPYPDDREPPLQVHDADPDGAALLAGQGVHVDAPAVAVYVLAEQSVQAMPAPDPPL